MSITAKVFTKHFTSGPACTQLSVYNQQGELIAGGPIGYFDCPRTMPEDVTQEDVRAILRRSGLEDIALLPIALTVGQDIRC